jgi:hypothetical protein
MIRKCITLCLLGAVAAVLAAGCGAEKQVDPYAQVTLRQATYGPPVISKGWKYKLVNPEIVEAAGHLCLVREGNVTSMIAGRSIADKIEAMDKTDITFNVVKKYSPYVHFKCEQVISGVDTVFISAAGSIFYPTIKQADEFRARDYDDEINWRNMRYNNSAGLRRAVEKKFTAVGNIAIEDEEGDDVWMITGGRDNVKLRVDDLDDSILMALRMITSSGMEFEGGVTFTEAEEWAERKNNQISGTVTIEWVKYGDFVFSVL